MAMLALLFLLFTQPAFALGEGTGLKINAAADLTGQFGATNQSQYPSRFEPREAEINIYGPIDHSFDGVAAFAAHRSDGEYHLEVHELYLSSAKLVPNLRLKAGKFFLGVGRLNQIHRHDWPFFNAPKMQREFFDQEAAADSGVQANYLFSFLPVYTELGVGLTSGWTFGHSHSAGEKPVHPTHYVRLQNFFPFGESAGLQTGLNYLGTATRADGERKIYGVDLVAKWNRAGVTTWLLQGEVFRRTLRSYSTGENDKHLAGYVYGQRHITGGLFGGLRLDGFDVQSSPTKAFDYSVVPTLTYKHSEFALFRAAYQLDYEKRPGSDRLANRVAQVQAVFFLGDHPTHDF